MSDFQRKITHTDGRELLIGKWRGGYSVAMKHKGTYHSIGSWGGVDPATGQPNAAPHAFQSGVADGQDYKTRYQLVLRCSRLPASSLPTEDIDPHWKAA